MQAFNGLRYPCAAAREPLAYELTVRWLAQQGVTDPYAVLNIDRFTIGVLSVCPDPD